ncbi:tetratricopeptide repeat protein [Sulfurospirillum barnesii]|uniref:tetratricopeptide repeat protein n=1 Tax=Sulfurospirillum barnesii TaxID=44674 RepID=UPI0002D723D0|nr:hypothetical protein [Sulfurospirillum barnesii]
MLSAEPSAYGTIDSNSISSKEIISQDVNSYQTTPNVPVPSKSIRYSEPEASSSNSSEQYEGVRSVLQSYETKISKQDARIRELEDEMGKLKGYVEESRKIQLENQEKVKIVLAELSTLIDSINKNYVSKEKFDQLANELKGSKTVSSKQTATTPSDAANTTPEKEASSKTVSAKELSQKDSATLMKEADDLFETKAYANAEVMYKELLNRNYKPAKANFSLGEIAYSKKSYAMAIEYYKTSISLFDKAPYIPTLLYHTGASFEKLGKAKEAQGFYKALKENYPTSPEAKKVK